jgi:hypothetical protein
LRNVIGAGPAGIFVVEAVGGIDAIGKEAIAAGETSESEEAEARITGDAGLKQNEVVHAAAVNGQVENLTAIYQAGDVGFGALDKRSFGIHFDPC